MHKIEEFISENSGKIQGVGIGLAAASFFAYSVADLSPAVESLTYVFEGAGLAAALPLGLGITNIPYQEINRSVLWGTGATTLAVVAGAQAMTPLIS